MHWSNYEVMELGTSEVTLRIKWKQEDTSNSVNKEFIGPCIQLEKEEREERIREHYGFEFRR